MPESRDASGAQSMEAMRLSHSRRSEASKHVLYEARRPRTCNIMHSALRHRSAEESDIEVGVGVGVAPRWCVAQSGAKAA